MTDQQFAALALDLLRAASIPGSALDMAVEFRRIAQRIADGELAIAKPAPPSCGPGD